MFFKQYYLACLSHASYLIGDESTGQAVVVDPQRDIDEYLSDAATNGLKITRVIETHFHADFLSGHLEIAAHTGAEIIYGAAAAGRVEFPIKTYSNGDHISLGTVDLEILETPGHTPESICIVVRADGPTSAPYGVLTGDTLFIGDVGRPDLLASVGVTADELARELYRSLHEKLMTLPDETKVFPAHGAGSACGKNLSTETVSTIGEQRRTNYALAPMVVEDFVDVVTQGQSVAPLYFAFAANKNREARALLDQGSAVPELDFVELLKHQKGGAVIIDTRDDTAFAQAHLKGSINIGLSGRFADYAGQVMEPGTPIILVAEAGYEVEAKIRLARIGFDNVIGALAEPVEVFLGNPESVEQLSRLSAVELAERITSVEGMRLIDVRNPNEVALGSIPGALKISLPSLLGSLDALDPSIPTVLFCAGGYRSAIASSLLRSRGFSDVSDLIGGYAAWATTQLSAALPAITVNDVAADTRSILLDVREDDEWDAGHVPTALHIPMLALPDHLGELDRDHRIICICRSGNRSGQVTAWLISEGFDAVNMTGGMQAWEAAGQSVVDQSGLAGVVI